MAKRLVRSVVATAAAAMLTVGCVAADPTPSGEDDPITLTFANWQWLEPSRGEAMWEAMQEFTVQNPGITLRKQEITRADYEKTIQTQVGAGGGPDLLIVPPALLPELGDAGLLVSLDDAQVGASNVAAMEQYQGERLVYGWEVVNFAMFYNKALLEEAGVVAPTTPEELLAVSTAISDKTGKFGFAARHSLGEETAWWNDFTHWPYGFGGGWSENGQLTIDSAGNIAALTAFKALYDSGTMPVGDDASTFRSRFKSGEVGIMLDNASVLFTMVNGEGAMPLDQVGVAPLPFPTDDSSLITNFIGVNKNSEHAEAAVKFIEWLSSEQGQSASANGLFPTLNATAAAPSQEITDQNPWIDVYRQQAMTASGAPVITGFELQTSQIRTIVLRAVEEVLVADRDPAEALRAAQQQAEAIR